MMRNSMFRKSSIQMIKMNDLQRQSAIEPAVQEPEDDDLRLRPFFNEHPDPLVISKWLDLQVATQHDAEHGPRHLPDHFSQTLEVVKETPEEKIMVMVRERLRQEVTKIEEGKYLVTKKLYTTTRHMVEVPGKERTWTKDIVEEKKSWELEYDAEEYLEMKRFEENLMW